MTQCELNREVSRATGESVRTIRRLGFGLDNSSEADPQDVSAPSVPNVVDWDALDAQRTVLFPHRPARSCRRLVAVLRAQQILRTA